MRAAPRQPAPPAQSPRELRRDAACRPRPRPAIAAGTAAAARQRRVTGRSGQCRASGHRCSSRTCAPGRRAVTSLGRTASERAPARHAARVVRRHRRAWTLGPRRVQRAAAPGAPIAIGGRRASLTDGR